MSLSRKRKKELKKLRRSAEELWSQQQELVSNANALAAQAKRQAGHYTREEIAPRVARGYEHYVRPFALNARDTAVRYADVARERVVHDVIPAVATVVGTALSVVDQTEAARAAAVIKQSQSRAYTTLRKPVKKSGGFGTTVAITLGVAASVGVVYALWQTFRTDDELWVSDESAEKPAV